MEPQEPGSGLSYACDCKEEVLAKNWQRLILTHLQEREHRGVLTGSALTDVKFTLIAGRAHVKHTEGGDFRQATYRAVRQGLMAADCILLEPYYAFLMELPEEYIGRAMMDVERRFGTCSVKEIEKGRAILTGQAPVSTIGGYQKELHAYTRGLGSIQCVLKGYYPCHNTEEVVERKGMTPWRICGILRRPYSVPTAAVIRCPGMRLWNTAMWTAGKAARRKLPGYTANAWLPRKKRSITRETAGNWILPSVRRKLTASSKRPPMPIKGENPGKGFYRKTNIKPAPAETVVYKAAPKKKNIF